MKSSRTTASKLLQGLLLTFATLLLAPAAAATTGIMNVWGTVTLTENHYGTIVLNGDSARLDCNGKAIYDSTQPAFCGEDGDLSCGIYVVGLDAPYVINCNVRNFDIGLYVSTAYLPTVRNSTFRYNAEGMRIVTSTGSSSTFVLNNTFRDNTEQGLVIRGTSSLRVTSNRFWYNDSDGADVEGGSGLVFNRNDHKENTWNGLEFDDVSRITVSNSTFVSNGIGTNRNGLSLDNSDIATLTGNTLTDNERSGVRVGDDSDSGTFTNNTGSGNGSEDAFQSANSSNTWSGNDWGSTSPAGLD